MLRAPTTTTATTTTKYNGILVHNRLARFASQNSSHFPNKMTRYIQLASLLPSKSVRDVALRVVQQEAIPNVAQSAAANMSLPEGINVVDLRHHEWLNQLLTSNVTLINKMRDNLVQKQAHANLELYSHFRTQASTIQGYLASLPIQLPEPNFTATDVFASKKGEVQTVFPVQLSSALSSSGK